MTLRAMLRADPIPVRVGPHTLTVPAANADVWLMMLESGQLDDVVPGMLDVDGAAIVADALIDGSVSSADLFAAAKTVVRDACGRSWYEGVRIAMICGQDAGAVLAGVMLKGIDPTRVTYATWCAAVLAWLYGRIPDEKREQFLFDFRLPPDGDFSQVEGFDSVQF